MSESRARVQISNASRAPVAWIVGGSRGIGAAVADLLDRDGWRIVVSGRGAGELEQRSDRRWSLPVEVRDDETVRRATHSVVGALGRLDATIVSVREQGEGSFASLSDEEWLAALDTKLIGFVRIARHVLPLLEQSAGSLVSIVGSAATMASAQHPLGCVNAALRHAIRGLAMEWGPRGVRVLGMSPGPTRTAGLTRLIDEMAASRGVPPASIEDELAGATHRGRMLQPEEVAALVVFLLSPASAPLNGTVVQADDGTLGGCL